MIFIYTGGEVLQSPNGIYYNLGYATVILVRPRLCYLSIKGTICQNLGENQGHQYDLNIQVRISMPTSSAQTWF